MHPRQLEGPSSESENGSMWCGLELGLSCRDGRCPMAGHGHQHTRGSTSQRYEQSPTGRPSVLPGTADYREGASGSRHGFDIVTKSLTTKSLPHADHIVFFSLHKTHQHKYCHYWTPRGARRYVPCQGYRKQTIASFPLHFACVSLLP